MPHNSTSVSALTQYKKQNLIGARSTLSTFGSTDQLKNLSLSKIYESKRVKDVEMMQLHTRIQYLQNEEFKKLRKIDQSRKLA